ncbi:MAG: helix-turn-helix domain-containing protein [Bacteroides heparinolyticus]|nr:helix-turn-helix domain-containing protein [Bacteroides heparinolyticus]
MAELTTQQKKEYAGMLYLKENLTMQEIAEKVNVTRQTVSRWIKAEKWEERKVGITLTREEQIANLHRQVAEINKVIGEREAGKRFASPAEADTLGKLASAIKKMENDVGLSDIISVGMRFIEWLRPVDLERAKEFTALWDAFIKDSL